MPDFEPLAIAIDQTDQGDRRPGDRRCQGDQAVELLLGIRVQDSAGLQVRKTLRFTRMERRL